MASALQKTQAIDLSTHRRPKREAGNYKAVEMLIEPGAEKLLEDMGRLMKSKARSKVIDAALTLIHENAQYLSFLAALVEKGRPAILLDLVYFAAVNLSREDLESLRH